MNSIIYVGMDVHATSYTLSAYRSMDEKEYHTIKTEPNYKRILEYIEIIKAEEGEVEIICGYEAGCLGYTLYRQLREQNVKCEILAPTTIPTLQGKKRIKTDKRDAQNIARSLAHHTYRAVKVPTKEDEEVKNYIRMRDDHKMALKKIKQQILAECLRQGYRYTEGSNWTMKHIEWLKKMVIGGIENEVMEEYMITYKYMREKLNRMDKRIAELASQERYEQKVERLRCFIGIETHTALSMVVEVGDYQRFKKAGQFASYLGLIPGEESSGEKVKGLGITKAGNTHLRRLLVEAAQCYTRGRIAEKSSRLKKRQEGKEQRVIEYADKGNERLKRKYQRMVLGKNKRKNVAITAVARELACFVWGMMILE